VTVDRSAVRDLCPDAVFQRGWTYREEGRIERLSRFDAVVTAQVRGSEPYDVRVRLDQDDFDPSCTCPYDGPGECKHVVAVLLAVADDPPADEADRIDSLLDELSAENLRAFVRSELAERPAVRERFLAQFGETTDADADEYRADVDHLFDSHTSEYPVVTEAIDFSRFTDLAERYRERGEHLQAAAVYRGLSEGIAENMNLVDGAYDHYAGTFQSALDGYVACLAAASLDEESLREHRAYLDRRTEEAVDYLTERYAVALDELE
jgi:uncharacterized Zn finger protein